MTVIAPPFTHAQIEGDLGSAYDLADEVRLAMNENLDVLRVAGVLALQGDLLHSGSDTIRVSHMGGVGFGATMTTVANETATVAASSMTTGYTDVTLGIHRFKMQSTYTEEGLRRPGVLSFAQLMGLVPMTAARKIRVMWTDLGATIGLAVSATGAQLTVDKYLELGAVHSSSVAFYGLGRPVVALHPFQMFDQTYGLLDSVRAETAITYGGPVTFGQTQGVNGSQVLPDWLNLGMDVILSDDVETDGTDYQGFSYRPGSLGYAVMSTGTLETANPAGTLRVPEYGLIIEKLMDGANQTVNGFVGTMWLGMAKGEVTVWGPQRRIISHD